MLPLIAMAGASIIGGMLSANGAKSAAAKASDANWKMQQETNALNERLFNQSRGSDGHSILPTYFGGNEAQAGQMAYDQFARMAGQSGDYAQQLYNYQSQLSPALNASFDAIGNRFNGADLLQRQQYAQPFFDARTSQAQTYGQGLQGIAGANSSAINVGLMQALGRLNAGRQAQGFLGGSTYDRNRLAASLIGARQQAAIMQAQARAGGQNALSEAALANAGDLRSMNIADLDFRSRPDALGAAFNAGGSFLSAPAMLQANMFNQGLSSLNFFKMNPQAFQAQNMPQQSPELNNSQILGGAIGQAGQMGMNYSLYQQLLKNMSGGNGPQMTYNQFMNVGNSGGGFTPISTDFLPSELPI